MRSAPSFLLLLASANLSALPLAPLHLVPSAILRPSGRPVPELRNEPARLDGEAPDGSKVIIPLVHSSVEVEVRGVVATTQVVQRYENKGSQPLEAVYTFPLPHDASVYDLEITVANRVIRSVVKEREEARRTYEAARSNGQRAALMDEERPNIFTMHVANIMPQDRVDIRLRYVEPLAWEGGRIRLVLPTTIGPRFIPSDTVLQADGTVTYAVKDAALISPPIAVTCGGAGHDVSLKLTVDLGVPIEVSSPTHALRGGASGLQWTVALADGEVIPNRDIVIDVDQLESAQPRTALFLSAAEGEDTHFLLVAYPPASSSPEEAPPMEWMFLVDVSGSMSGTSMDQARQSMAQALDRIRPKDRFNIITYSSDYTSMAPEALAGTAENLATARDFVSRMQANGGTVMLPALEHLMAMKTESRWLRCIVLMTDGDLGNEQGIFQALQARLGSARLYTVAVGTAPNHHLATRMAELGRGSFTHIANGAEIEMQMRALLNRVQAPALTDVQLAFDGVTAEQRFPTQTPDLLLGSPLRVFGVLHGRKGSLTIHARKGEKPWRHKVEIDVATATFHPAITTLWARQMLDAQLAAYHADPSAQVDRRREIVTQAIRYNLVTPFTSRIAVEELVVNPGGDQASTHVPVEFPEGWDRAKVLGENPKTGTADAFLQLVGWLCLLAGISLWLVRQRRLRL